MPKIVKVKPELAFFRFTDEDVTRSPILQDAKIFLEFVQKNKPRLTSYSKNLTRKDIYFLNERLQKPDKLDLIIDNKIIRRLQNETEASTIHFLNNLCQIGRLVRRDRHRLIITKMGKDYLNKPSMLYFTLWQVWLFHYNWLYFSFIFEEKVVEAFQDNFPLIALFFLEQPPTWLTTEEFFARSLALDPREFSSTFERVVLRKLEYFGIIETQKEKDKLGFEKITYFKLTPFGQKVFTTTFHISSLPQRVD